MIDALVYAIRDGIRAGGMNYDYTSCDLMDDGRPPPRAGNVFVSIHDAMVRSDRDNQLHEWYEFSVTLTMRVVVPLDKVGDQVLHRNVARIPLGERQGFWARIERLRAFLHMNWKLTVLTNQTPPSANDNLVAWSSGDQVYGFCEPMRFLSAESMKMVGGEWFASDVTGDDEPIGMKATLKFGKCRRFQPQTEPDGPFT